MYTVQLLAQNQQNLLMLLVRRGQICVSRTLIIGLCLILSLDIVDFSITMVFGKLASTMTSMAGLASASTPSSVVHSTNSASCLETVMGMGMVVASGTRLVMAMAMSMVTVNMELPDICASGGDGDYDYSA